MDFEICRRTALADLIFGVAIPPKLFVDVDTQRLYVDTDTHFRNIRRGHVIPVPEPFMLAAIACISPKMSRAWAMYR